jgi:hypothetical protein
MAPLRVERLQKRIRADMQPRGNAASSDMLDSAPSAALSSSTG